VVDILGIVDAEGDEGQAAETELKGEPEDDAAEQPCEDTTAVLQNCLDLLAIAVGDRDWVCSEDNVLYHRCRLRHHHCRS